jgi:hypothetical protein
MNGQRILIIALACVACVGWIQRPQPTEAKRVIGQTEMIAISDASLALVARVDTGARTTSVHAENIEIADENVRFELVGNCGQRIAMERPITKTATVRNASGIEERVFVELTLEHDGNSKPVLVNLRDRSRMTYPLLLGRNWLQGDYVVDVSHEPVIPKVADRRTASMSHGNTHR